MFADEKCSIPYHHIIIAFHPVWRLNICANVSGRAVNITDQNNSSGWVLVKRKKEGPILMWGFW